MHWSACRESRRWRWWGCRMPGSGRSSPPSSSRRRRRPERPAGRGQGSAARRVIATTLVRGRSVAKNPGRENRQRTDRQGRECGRGRHRPGTARRTLAASRTTVGVRDQTSVRSRRPGAGRRAPDRDRHRRPRFRWPRRHRAGRAGTRRRRVDRSHRSVCRSTTSSSATASARAGTSPGSPPWPPGLAKRCPG